MKKVSELTKDELEVRKLLQGILGEKIAANIFNKENRFVKFIINRFASFDLILSNKKSKEVMCQIKTMVPYVTKGYWSISGKEAISNFFKADEAYVISIPTIPFKGCEFMKKYEGKMLKVSTDQLKKYYNGKDSTLKIPISDEYVTEYANLDEEDVKELLKYPVSNYTANYNSWKK